MVHENRRQTNLLIGAFVLTGALSTAGAARAQPNPQRDVERVIRDFLVAFEQS